MIAGDAREEQRPACLYKEWMEVTEGKTRTGNSAEATGAFCPERMGCSWILLCIYTHPMGRPPAASVGLQKIGRTPIGLRILGLQVRVVTDILRAFMSIQLRRGRHKALPGKWTAIQSGGD